MCQLPSSPVIVQGTSQEIPKDPGRTDGSSRTLVSMQFSVLGPVTVIGDDISPLALGGWKQLAVLALLLNAPSTTVSADRIITEVWGDQASSGARDALYTYISNLRGVLGRDRIEREHGGYRLVAQPEELEAHTFEMELARAERLIGSAPNSASRLLLNALNRWTGRAYEGHEDLPAIQPEAARLDELLISAQELRFDAILRAGETLEPADVAVLCRDHPFRERAWGLLMRSEYRAGRQADALRTFQQFQKTLGEELGLEPSPSLVRLEEQILLQDPSLDPDQTTPTNLPTPLTSFVGRLDEQASLDEAVHGHRLVTVLGPGGAGKTRLAVETARTLQGLFSDGVWIVDLAQVNDPAGVPDTVAATLGIATGDEGDEALLNWLAARTVLIILDNCEHLVDAAGRIAQRILEHTHEVKILATSRIALNRPGEQRIAILGLQQGDGETEMGEAVELFVDRAKAFQSSLDLGSDTIAAIRSICGHVDGLPLAIELAASRTDVLSVNEISEFLRESPALLEAEHASRDIHRSLDAAITWSVSLLDEDQRARFRGLGVFDGPFTAEATASIFRSGHLDAVRELKPLADASLVVARPTEAGGTVYRLLEPLRQYARRSLREAGDWAQLTEMHDLYYVRASRSRRSGMLGSGRVEAVRRIEVELADYMSAWDRLAEQDPTAVLPLAWSLGHHWLSAHVSSGFARMATLLEAVGDNASVEVADALTISSWVAMYANDWERGIPWVDRAISIYEEADDQLGLAYANARKGHWAFGRGDAAGAMASLSLSLEICDRIGNEEGKAWPTVLIGQARRWGDDDSDDVHQMLLDAKALFASTDDSDGQVHAGMVLATFFNRDVAERLIIAEEMADLAEQRGADSALRPTAFHALSSVTWELGQRERAEGLNRACVRAAFASGNLIVLGLGLMQAARYAGLRGHSKRCATLNGAGRAHFAFELAPFQLRYEADGVSAAKAVLGETEYDGLFDQGALMTAEEAAALALR